MLLRWHATPARSAGESPWRSAGRSGWHDSRLLPAGQHNGRAERAEGVGASGGGGPELPELPMVAGEREAAGWQAGSCSPHRDSNSAAEQAGASRQAQEVQAHSKVTQQGEPSAGQASAPASIAASASLASMAVMRGKPQRDRQATLSDSLPQSSALWERPVDLLLYLPSSGRPSMVNRVACTAQKEKKGSPKIGNSARRSASQRLGPSTIYGPAPLIRRRAPR